VSGDNLQGEKRGQAKCHGDVAIALFQLPVMSRADDASGQEEDGI